MTQGNGLQCLDCGGTDMDVARISSTVNNAVCRECGSAFELNDGYAEQVAEQAEELEAAERLRLRVEAAADQVLRLVPDSVAAMVARAEAVTAARRALGGAA